MQQEDEISSESFTESESGSEEGSAVVQPPNFATRPSLAQRPQVTNVVKMAERVITAEGVSTRTVLKQVEAEEAGIAAALLELDAHVSAVRDQQRAKIVELQIRLDQLSDMLR